MIIFMNSIARGGHDQMIEDAIAAGAGHIQIHENGYWNNRAIDYAFQVTPALQSKIAGDSRITGYSKRIFAEGLLSFKKNTAGAKIEGIEPDKEAHVSNFHTKILSGGRYLVKSDMKQVIVGEVLAKNLDAKIGSIISLISQGFDGSIAAEKLTVAGLMRTGNPEYDRTLLLMPLSQANETFTMMGYIHSMTIRLSGSLHTEDVVNDIQHVVFKQNLEVMSWDSLMPELVQFIIIDDLGEYIFIFILFILVAFGVLNTIQMSVFERTRELGITYSILSEVTPKKSSHLYEEVNINTKKNCI